LLLSSAFPPLIVLPSVLVMKDQMDVCSLSRRGLFHPLSTLLPRDFRFFHHPVPALSSAPLTSSIPLSGRVPDFHVPREYQDGLGSASPPVVLLSASEE
jgi:hypothetical protein